MYESEKPSQTGCAATPIRTKTIRPRSRIDRGRNAEMTPIGKAINSQRRVPPMRSASVTGIASQIIFPTGWL